MVTSFGNDRTRLGIGSGEGLSCCNFMKDGSKAAEGICVLVKSAGD